MEGCHLGIQRIIANAERGLLAAAMRCRHLRLPALILHHAAAGTFLGAHGSIGNHAGHCRARHDTSNKTSMPNWRRTCITKIRLRPHR